MFMSRSGTHYSQTPTFDSDFHHLFLQITNTGFNKTSKASGLNGAAYMIAFKIIQVCDRAATQQ